MPPAVKVSDINRSVAVATQQFALQRAEILHMEACEMRRFFKVAEGEERYGGKVSAWRKWVLSGALGDAVKRFGRLVRIDATILDERLARTGQLLISSPHEATPTEPLRLNTTQIEPNGVPPNKKATDSHSVARREVRRADATTQT
jgi:hypothetical protein